MTAKKERLYENDIYIKRWLVGLSPKTKENYPNFLQDFLTFVGMTPTEIINKRMNDLTSKDIIERCFFVDKWRAFKESLESTGLNSDSKVHDRLKVASSFFTRNGLPLELKKGDWDSCQKQGITEKKEKLDLNDLKTLYGHANLTEKCLLLILAQSGFSETDISELKVEDIQGLYEMAINENYVIEKKRDKTVIVQATCLSYEFLHDLRSLLDEKGRPTKGFIFTSRTVDKEKNLPIDTRRINEIIKKLYEKTFSPERAKKLQTRTLRSFYNGALLAVKPSINPEIKDLLMGHDRGGARNSYQYNDETIKEAYLSAFEYLSINGLQSREDLKNLKEDMEKKIGKLTIDAMKEKEDLQNQIDEQNEKINEILGMLSVVAKGKGKISIETTKEGTQISLSGKDNQQQNPK